MFERLLHYFAPLPEVRVARTSAELEGVYRLRYQIQVGELGTTMFPGADHEKQTISSPLDVAPNTTILYVGEPGAPTASLRMQVFLPGTIPPEVQAKYSHDLFPDVASRVVSFVGGLCAAKGVRGSASVVALTCHGVELGVGTHGVEVLFAECRPGLLRAYRKLGLRPYGGRPIVMGGLLLPVVAITGDLEHLARVGSPWLPVLRRLRAQERFPTRDHRPLLDALEGGGGVEVEPERVVAEVGEAMQDEAQHFLHLLSEGARERIVRAGFILDVQTEVEILSTGIANRELFIVLEGVYEVLRGDRHVSTLGPGEVFGEIAYFHGGHRTASVWSRSDGRLLVLRPRALEELAVKHPEDVIEIYRALAGVLAQRLASPLEDARSTRHPGEPSAVGARADASRASRHGETSAPKRGPRATPERDPRAARGVRHGAGLAPQGGTQAAPGREGPAPRSRWQLWRQSDEQAEVSQPGAPGSREARSTAGMSRPRPPVLTGKAPKEAPASLASYSLIYGVILPYEPLWRHFHPGGKKGDRKGLTDEQRSWVGQLLAYLGNDGPVPDHLRDIHEELGSRHAKNKLLRPDIGLFGRDVPHDQVKTFDEDEGRHGAIGVRLIKAGGSPYVERNLIKIASDNRTARYGLLLDAVKGSPLHALLKKPRVLMIQDGCLCCPRPPG